jgi:hypothetical protein
VPEEVPPLANPGAGKPAGGISQLDIENSLRFNNSLVMLSVTAANLERIFEHAVAATTPTSTPGQFPQIGGALFSFDPTLPAQRLVTVGSGATALLSDAPADGGVVGERIRSLALYNDDGSVADVIVKDGVFQGDPNRVIKLVTLNFLANPGANPLLGGDGYPFPAFTIPGSRVNLLDNPALTDGSASFARKGSEQDALAEFLLARHGTPAVAFDRPDTTRAEDVRIQHLAFREDTVGDPFAHVTIGPRSYLFQMTKVTTPPLEYAFTGSAADEVIRTHANNDRVSGGAGNDTIFAGAGNDLVDGSGGSDVLHGEAGNDTLLGGARSDTLLGGAGNDLLNGGAGADLMQGGLGNDIYRVDNPGDVVVELPDEGYDIVRSSVSFMLPEHVEELQMLVGGTAGTGNALNNRIRGSDGADTIDGGAGDDRIIGGLGPDVLTGGDGRDTFIFTRLADSAPGVEDLITDFVSGQDQAFTFVGTGAFLGGGQASIRYTFAGGETLVQFDTGDGGAPEMVVRLTGNIALQASDFLL